MEKKHEKVKKLKTKKDVSQKKCDCDQGWATPIQAFEAINKSAKENPVTKDMF